MLRFRRWFIAHWFLGVFVILGGVWAVTLAFYVAGAEGITFGNPYGEDATIDFQRKHDLPVLVVRHDVGLELMGTSQGLNASLVTLEDGPPVICWICGERVVDEGLAARVQYRAGP